MEYQDITVAVQDGIATVTLNRPQKLKQLNAYTTLMGNEITHAYESLGKREDVRVIIMTGAGRGFCSGADVGAVFQKDINQRSTSETPRGNEVVHSRSGLHYALYNCAKPTIAAINGPAVGIGLTLTLLQDIRIMAEEASMGAIFARMGLMPELGSTFMLPRLVGLAKALEFTYTAKILKGKEALDIGLVNQVVPGEALMTTVRDMAAQISPRCHRLLSLFPSVLSTKARRMILMPRCRRRRSGWSTCIRRRITKRRWRRFFEKRPAKFQGK